MSAETLFDLLRTSATATPDAVALTDTSTHETVTYAELQDRALRAAAGLRALGFSRGDTLAIWLSNGVEWVVLEFASAYLGVLVCGLNPRYKPNEIAHLLRVSQARALVFAPSANGIDYAAMAAEAITTAGPSSALSRLIVVDRTGATWAPPAGLELTGYEELLVAAATSDEETGRPGDLINVFGTSGTTSFPKLAAHDLGSVARHARETAAALEYSAAESVLCFLPFCGAYGFITLTSTLAAGARAVIMPVFKPDAAIRLVGREKITSILGLEATIRALFDVPGLDAAAVESWVKGGIAGLSATALVERAEDDFGIALTNLYGSSELFAMMACWPLTESSAMRSVPGGRLLGTDMQVRAVDSRTREILKDGESGELELSGYNVTSGYLSNPAANEKAFTADGWYRTGDQGATLEGGRAVRYEGRLADTLRLRGYLVSPVEIEELLATHAVVTEVQVVGTSNPATGEDRAVAFVRLSDPPEGLDAELRAHCRARAASWKVPDAVLFVTEFPTTPRANGEKVQKAKLREMAEAFFADSAGIPGAHAS
jgi:fatty-acyl-CoA synthase